MPEFTVNPTRHDPYKNFRFQVKWDGQYIPGVSWVSPLIRDTEVVEHREGTDAVVRRAPGLTSFEPITISRGLTHDTAFEAWANKCFNLEAGAGSEVSLKDYRKDIVINLLNEAGQLVMSYRVYRAWVARYEPLSALDADDDAVIIETITLVHEGWERDKSVTEPTEPSYTDL